MPTRSASAHWQGNLPQGSGTVSLGSGAFTGQYSFSSRFEEGTGTNPEELLGAAHAGCFSMAFSKVLDDNGYPPRSIETTAKVKFEKQDAGFTVTRIDLATTVAADGIDGDTLTKLAEVAKVNCPISRALNVPEVTVTATLS